MSRLLVSAAICLSFIGGFITLGGLAALQSDTPDAINSQVKPYRFPWTVWSLEVFVLLFGIFAVVKDFPKLKGPLLSLVAVVTTFVITLINEHIYHTAQLPGSNGTATRGNITIAGLIIVAIGNFGLILATAAFNLSVPPPSPRSSNADFKTVDV